MALILALESSCDDSAAALVGSDRQILAQAVVGQNDAHRPFGGVVPEIAARAHVEILPGLVRQILHEADITIGEVDAIAATAGPIVERVAGAFTESEQWKEIVARIRMSSQFKPAADLKGARRMFQPFAAAVVEAARRARQQPAFAAVRLFRCPMTDQAYPGAPKTAMWVQTNAPLRNPFFGSEMIDCGAEVKQ